jgi:quercetin dioxygenase-like cupin family protein
MTIPAVEIITKRDILERPFDPGPHYVEVWLFCICLSEIYVFTKTEEITMIAMNSADVENVQVGSVPYRGKSSDAKQVGVRWLSKVGQDAEGSPAYGLRLFTVGPAGEIPIHNHAYVQTMYFISGKFECWAFDPDTDKMVDKRICGPGDMVYIPSQEPHGMRNLSETESGEFLCCICTLEASTVCPG